MGQMKYIVYILYYIRTWGFGGFPHLCGNYCSNTCVVCYSYENLQFLYWNSNIRSSLIDSIGKKVCTHPPVSGHEIDFQHIFLNVLLGLENFEFNCTDLLEMNLVRQIGAKKLIFQT